MSGKLGREVEDHELVSLSSWIEAERKEDARKGIKVKTPPVQITTPGVAVVEKVTEQETEKKAVEKTPEKEPDSPDNCLKCGAALSKAIAYCQFCGTHTSRHALEQHVGIFLIDLEKDFELMVPQSHGHLEIGCLFIPLLAVATTAFGYFLLPSANLTNAVLFGIPILSLIVAYIWFSLVHNYVFKKQGLLFEQNIEPKIRKFMKDNNLQDIEMLSIAKRKFRKENKLLRHIYQRF